MYRSDQNKFASLRIDFTASVQQSHNDLPSLFILIWLSAPGMEKIFFDFWDQDRSWKHFWENCFKKVSTFLTGHNMYVLNWTEFKDWASISKHNKWYSLRKFSLIYQLTNCQTCNHPSYEIPSSGNILNLFDDADQLREPLGLTIQLTSRFVTFAV